MWRNRRLGATAALAAVALVFASCGGDNPPRAAPDPAPSPSPSPEPTCPLSGLVAPGEVDLDRPALAVKIENYPSAYPLSGLEDAELVYEELVEGGITRFMALYHCTDSERVGPIRSVRLVDIAIMTPITRLVAAAGGNDYVIGQVRRAGIFIVDEPESTPHAMQRISTGLSKEHTLFGITGAMRDMGDPSAAQPPPPDLLTFGEMTRQGRRAELVNVSFGAFTNVTYEWDGDAWTRSQAGATFVDEQAEPIQIDNLIIEEHIVNNSRTQFDVAGNPSTEIADETGSGRVLLFRDGRMVRGRWERDTLTAPVRYLDRDGDPLPLKPGRTWIALLPGPDGELQGSFSFESRASVSPSPTATPSP